MLKTCLQSEVEHPDIPKQENNDPRTAEHSCEGGVGGGGEEGGGLRFFPALPESKLSVIRWEFCMNMYIVIRSVYLMHVRILLFGRGLCAEFYVRLSSLYLSRCIELYICLWISIVAVFILDAAAKFWEMDLNTCVFVLYKNQQVPNNFFCDPRAHTHTGTWGLGC